MVNVRSAALTHPGRKRPNNEDFITFFEPSDEEVLRHSGRIYILADGVGGASKGERASQYAAQKILHDYYQYTDMPVPDRLRTILRQAGNDIYEYAESQSQYMQMATTVVVAVVRGETVQVAHVGDSRAYLAHNGQVTQLTSDHNTVGELLRSGTLTEEEAFHFDGRNPLSRSLGGQRDVRVDVTEPIPFKPGDKLLLSSDGLTRYTTRQNISDLLNQGDPDDVIYRMVDYANQSGGADNVSVVIIEALSKAEAGAVVAKGQKPTPVDWESIPTLPQNFVFAKQTSRKSVLPKVFVGLGAAILLALVVFFGGRALGLFPKVNETETPVVVVEPTVTESTIVAGNPEVNEPQPTIEPLPTLTDTVSATPPPETTESPATGNNDGVPEQGNPEATPTLSEEQPTLTPTEPSTETVSPDQIGYCRITVDFTDFDSVDDCLDINIFQLDDETVTNRCVSNFNLIDDGRSDTLDVTCLIRCKFPDLVNQDFDFQEYAQSINSVDYIYNEETWYQVYDGWLMRFPNISRGNCESIGGEFEVE